MKQLKELKKGDYFKRNENGFTVYVKGEYVRELKKYSCHKFDDVNSEIFVSAKKEVFVNFEF